MKTVGTVRNEASLNRLKPELSIPENSDHQLHVELGQRRGLLRAHPQLLPSGIRLRKDRPEEPKTEFRNRLFDRRVSCFNASLISKNRLRQVPE